MNDRTHADANEASAPIDLSGVDPAHWDEARRRVDILRKWCSRTHHKKSERVAAAAQMGTSLKQFERLVAVWKRYGEARRISGHPIRRGRRIGGRVLAEATRSAIEDAIAAFGPDARFSQVLGDATRRWEESGAPSASSGTVYNMLMRARQSQTVPLKAREAEIIIASVSCLMPVVVDDHLVERPDLVLAVLSADGRILAHEIALDRDKVAAARSIIAAIERLGWAGDVSLARDIKGAAFHRGRRIDLTEVRIRASSTSEGLARIVGRSIGDLPIRHRQTAEPSPPPQPIGVALALKTVEKAVGAHNKIRGRPRP